MPSDYEDANFDNFAGQKCILIATNEFKEMNARKINTDSEIQRITQQNDIDKMAFKSEIENMIQTEERDKQTLILYNISNKTNGTKEESKTNLMGIINELNDSFSNPTMIVCAIPPVNETIDSNRNKEIMEINNYIQSMLEPDN